MKHLPATLGFAAIVALVVIGGVIHGRISGRWGSGSQMLAAGEKLMELPAQFGPWKLQDSRPFDESTLRELEPAGYVERTYVNQDTSEQIGLMMIVGKVGPVSVHTPEVCIGNQRFDAIGVRQKVSVNAPDGTRHSVWSIAFRSRAVDGHVLQTYYAWSTGGAWRAPEDARYSFAGEPYLYKMQLSGPAPPRAAAAPSAQVDAGQRFLRALIPVAQKYLIQPASK